ncbi:hypothetical protein MAR_035466 [Mya arenaria]|uniref:Uncharacterized protein n=1 Tax=Mya arenaria TaxID=6604 RepID=A0ABY7EME5_MYAAR|nr:hypothetical protein MAR_035466 [Mya arenaria]
MRAAVKNNARGPSLLRLHKKGSKNAKEVPTLTVWEGPGLFPVLVEEKTDASSYWDTDAENPIFKRLFPVLVEEKTDASSYWDTDAENPIFKKYVGKLELKIVISAKLELQLRQIKMEIMMAVAYFQSKHTNENAFGRPL